MFSTPSGLASRNSSFQSPNVIFPRTPATAGRRANKAFVLDAGGHHVLKATGCSPPVLVIELLLSAGEEGGSVCLSGDGLAWVVVGRRLIVWDFAASLPSASQQPKSSVYSIVRGLECWELPLAPSDLRLQKAELVVVLPHPSGRADRHPIALAASPDGHIRYWANISQPEHYTEINTELQGQICNSLVPLIPRDPGSLNFVLSSTTGTLLIVEISLDTRSGDEYSRAGSRGRSSHTVLSYRRISGGVGFFGSLGKRLSTMLLGSSRTSPSSSDAAELMRILTHRSSIYVLQGGVVRIWDVVDGRGEQTAEECLVTEWNGEPHVRRAFMEKLWDAEADVREVQVHLLDIAMFGVNLFLLCASTFDHITAFALAEVCIEDALLIKFRILPHTFEEEASEASTNTGGSRSSSRLRIPLPAPPTPQPAGSVAEAIKNLSWRLTAVNQNPADPVLVAHNQQIFIVHSTFEEDPVVLDFGEPVVIGTGIYGNSFHTYSKVHGILKLQHRLAEVQPALTSSFSVLDRSVVGQTTISHHLGGASQTLKLMDLPLFNDNSLRDALLFYIRGELLQAHRTVESIVKLGGRKLDEAVVGFSRDSILDDYPAGDPRWKKVQEAEDQVTRSLEGSESRSRSLGLSRSVLIQHQLTDKIQAHDLYLVFLMETALWDRLENVYQTHPQTSTSSGTLVPSIQILLDHGEKLRAAETLQRLPKEYSGILRQAMEVVLENRNKSLLNVVDFQELSVEEIFFRQVSAVQDLILALVHLEKQMLSQGNLEASEVVEKSTKIILSILSEVATYRTGISSQLEQRRVNKPLVLYPWTAREIRTALIEQHEKVKSFFPSSSGSDARVATETLVQLTDVILEGYQQQIAILRPDSVEGKKTIQEFEGIRRRLIQPIAAGQAFENALALAEKYLDFETLVEVCEMTGNRTRLEEYMAKLPGCTEFAMEWYYKRGLKNTLLQMKSGPGELFQFLSDKDSLRWLAEVQDLRFRDAANTLRRLAFLEHDSLQRKMNALTFAILAVRSSPDIPEKERDDVSAYLDNQIAICRIQESLPVDEHYPKISHVLSVPELVDELTNRENCEPSIEGFTLALKVVDLAQLPTDEERRMVYLIWSRAVLKQNWESLFDDHAGEPSEQLAASSFIGRLIISTGDIGGGLMQDSTLFRFIPVSERLWESVDDEKVLTNERARLIVEVVLEDARRKVSGVDLNDPVYHQPVFDVHAKKQEILLEETRAFLGPNMGLDSRLDSELLEGYLDNLPSF